MNIFELVGNTPVVDINLFRDTYPKAKILAKVEYLSPGGSLKDRPISRMLLNAHKSGKIRGKTILDSSSGNAGIAYALFGNVLGYPVELVVPGNASQERLKRIKAHGAKVTQTDPLEGYDEALRVAHRLHEQFPDRYYFADQYSNDDNWLAHYETTAEEILKQIPDITHFVGGIGTGGSLTGISRKLKERNRDILITAIRPDRFPGVEGLKPLGEPEDIVPKILDESHIDRYVEIRAEQSRDLCHQMALHGIFSGQSSGAYMAGVQAVLNEHPDGIIVTLLNDLGERYMSTGLWNK